MKKDVLKDFMAEKPKWEMVQECIAKKATEKEACDSVGISVEEYRKELFDPVASHGHTVALDLQRQEYEAELRDRALNGTKKETYDANGIKIKTVVEFDNELLKSMVQARDERYRANNKNETNVNIDFGAVLAKASDRYKRLMEDRKVIDVERA
jgi:hypothetical protein